MELVKAMAKSKAKVILLCGKTCVGKTTYAKHMTGEGKIVLISVDETMLALFGNDLGGKHDEIAAKTKEFLLQKVAEIVTAGADVVLDWGFWTREERLRTNVFFKEHNVDAIWHYLELADTDARMLRLRQRNADVKSGKTNFFVIDEKAAKKFDRMFEVPDRIEMDVWYEMWAPRRNAGPDSESKK